MQNGIMSFTASTFIAICSFGFTIVGGLVALGMKISKVLDKIDQVAEKQVEQQTTIERHEADLQQHTIKFVRLEQKCPLLTPIHPESGK